MHRHAISTAVALMVALLVGCEGPAGPRGEMGDAGPPGERGERGPAGPPGQDADAGLIRTATFSSAGLKLKLLSAEIAGDGTATAEFRLTDGNGTPLDLEGRYTEGAVRVRFILAWLDMQSDGPGQYTAYTTRTQMSEMTGDSAQQASSDSDGTFELLDPDDGLYRYTFGTNIEVAEASATHTVGAYAEREVEGRELVSNDTLHFVPDGSDVALTRQIVNDEACNNCHGRLEAHGGARRGNQMCILCHTAQTTDPDTGNTVDFGIMIHKIHRGASLPSVEAGDDYEIIGYQDRVHDYSDVHFPQAVQNCGACHQGEQSSLAYERPTRRNCASCHDRTSFEDPPPEGYTLHAGGEQTDDSRCTVCHDVTATIAGMPTGARNAHFTVFTDPDTPVLELTLQDIRDTDPGQQPIVDFRVEVDGEGRDILSDPVNSLRATFAGPNRDFATYWTETIQPEGGGTLEARDAAAGEFSYTFATPIPDDALGNHTLGFEGNLSVDGSRVPAFAPTMAFRVGVDDLGPRRMVVNSDKCNACHGELRAHGGQRTNPNYCIMCHNPKNAGSGRAPRFEDEEVFIESVDFRVMIHKIHAGEELTQSYVLGGFPPPSEDNPAGSPVDFGHGRYPRPLNDCGACHVAQGTYEVPLRPGLASTRFEVRACEEPVDDDANDYCNDIPGDPPDTYWTVQEVITLEPATAVCTSCHDSPSTAAHAELMTTAMGQESCATCHGEGKLSGVSAVHATF